MTGASAPVFAALLGLVGLTALVVLRQAVRETTLLAAWAWAVLALAAVVTCATFELDSSHPGYCAAALTTFCPLMALLGAKRPQHRMWQFIVFSLWIVLALPSARALMLGRPLEIHSAERWFLLILVGMGLLNYLPTRFWVATLLLAAGQWAFLRDYLPWHGMSWYGGSQETPIAQQPMVGLAVFVGALVTAALISIRRRPHLSPVDRPWLDFRDAYGVFWAFRVMERVNVMGHAQHWPAELHWSGFRAGSSVSNEPLPTDSLELPLRGLRSVLRRFVSAGWIEERSLNVTETAVE